MMTFFCYNIVAMKNVKNLFLLVGTLLLTSFKALPKEATKTYDGRAYDKTLKMDFSPSTDNEIYQYYGYENMITHKGDDLKKYLYDITSKDNYFVSYGSGTTGGGVGQWYKITDRNWKISSPIDENTYLFNDDTTDKYFTVNMYYEESANDDPKKATNNGINGYTGTEGLDHIVHLPDGKGQKPSNGGPVRIDKEHVWAKNHGFKVIKNNTDTFEKGAPTDLHHLVAADGNTNSAGHNDNFYGEVKDKNSAKTIYCYYGDGSKAVSGWLGDDISGNKVFEPTDEWKGDVARCLFYMATRYSLDLGQNSQAEPFLVFSDNGSDDNTTFKGYHPNLETYLKWNKLDPVNEYESHRNSLIYKNVQKNRNPYVDFPSLADWVFSTTSETRPTIGGIAATDLSNLKDEYKIHVNDSLKPDIKIKDDVKVTSSDPDVVQIQDDRLNLKALKKGQCDITYSYKDDKEQDIEKKTHVVVNDVVTIKSVKIDQQDKAPFKLIKGEEYTLDIKLDENTFEDEKVEISSSDDLLQIDGFVIKPMKKGNTKIKIILKGDVTKELTTLDVEISLSEKEKKQQLIFFIIIVAIVAIILVIVIASIIHKKKKKRKKSKKKSVKK